jgi:hypothetical protein
MSVRENIELYHKLDLETYIAALISEYGATAHPAQPNTFIMRGLPFYAPIDRSDHVSILSFNGALLPYPLLQALADHPELAPDDVFVRWTQEQDLIWEGTLGELRTQIIKDR